MKDKTLYYLFFFLGIPFGILGSVMQFWQALEQLQGKSDIIFVLMVALVSILVSFVGFVGCIFAWMLQYCVWKRLQVLKKEDPSRCMDMPDAGVAVWFQFIPLFNWYWNFVSYCSLWKYARIFLSRRGIEDDFRIARWMGAGFASITILSQLCFLLMSIVSSVVGIGAQGISSQQLNEKVLHVVVPYMWGAAGLSLLSIVLFACLVTFMYRFRKITDVVAS